MAGMRTYGWRVAGVGSALLLVTAPWDSRVDALRLLAAVPVVIWYSVAARTAGRGLAVGAVLTALMAWMVVPGTIGWTGRWLVPSLGDLLTWYPWVSAAICFLGLWLDPQRQGAHRRHNWPRITALVVAGLSPGTLCLTCPGWWFIPWESPPGDERLFPMPDGLVVDDGYDCASGGCWRVAVVTGDRADARLRAHLAARGYRLRPNSGPADEFYASARHRTGVLVPHTVWLGYSATRDGTVRISWHLEPVIDI